VGEEDPRENARHWKVGRPDGALKKHLSEKDALHAGRKPRPDPEAVAVNALANSYPNLKKARLDAGD
jgi:hypothetical protein